MEEGNVETKKENKEILNEDNIGIETNKKSEESIELNNKKWWQFWK